MTHSAFSCGSSESARSKLQADEEHRKPKTHGDGTAASLGLTEAGQETGQLALLGGDLDLFHDGFREGIILDRKLVNEGFLLRDCDELLAGLGRVGTGLARPLGRIGPDEVGCDRDEEGPGRRWRCVKEGRRCWHAIRC